MVKRRHQNSVAPGHPIVDHLDQVVDLPLGRPDDDLGIDQTGRADNLLDDLLAVLDLVRRRGGRHEDALIDTTENLLELQRAVVARAGKAEAVLDEDVLARAVAHELAVQLRHRDVALVDDEQEVLREIVEQRERGLPRAATIDVHGVVLDAVAIADLLDHLQVVLRAHPQALRLEQLAFLLEPRQPLLQLGLDADHGLAHPLVAGDVVGGREDLGPWQIAERLAGEWIDHRQPIDRVAEHLDAQHRLLVRRVYFDGVAAHAELAATQCHVVAVELQVDEATQDAAHVVVDADAEVEQLPLVLLGVAHAVDAADGCDDDGVASGQQAGGRGVPQPVDLVVDRRVLLDVRVAGRDVRLGLVVVVVTDEVLDAILGKELAHLLGQLGGERLVGSQDQRRPLRFLNRPGDGRALARPGDAEQRLKTITAVDTLRELGDGLRLIACGLIVGDDLEVGHAPQSRVTNTRSPSS